MTIMSSHNHLAAETLSPQELYIGYGAGNTLVSDNHEQNEDDFLVDYDHQVFAVFDGIGSRDGSSAASAAAVKSIYEHFQDQPTSAMMEPRIARSVMRHAFIKAHNDIKAYHPGTATTAAALQLFHDVDGQPRALITHTGDSRVYRLRDGVLTGLTLDDAPRQEQDTKRAWSIQNALGRLTTNHSLGNASPDIRKAFHQRNVVTDALGMDGSDGPRITSRIVQVVSGDRFLLTTDGVHDNLTTFNMQNILAYGSDPKVAAYDLVLSAQETSRGDWLRSKPDDMSAVVVNLLGE